MPAPAALSHTAALQAWDATTLTCLRTLEGHEDNVRVLAVGQGSLFSGSWDKTVRVGASQPALAAPPAGALLASGSGRDRLWLRLLWPVGAAAGKCCTLHGSALMCLLPPWVQFYCCFRSPTHFCRPFCRPTRPQTHPFT